MRLLTEQDKEHLRQQCERQQERNRAAAIAHMQQLLVRISENDSDTTSFSCRHSTRFGNATAPVDDALVGRLAALACRICTLHLKLANPYSVMFRRAARCLTRRRPAEVIPVARVVDLPRTSPAPTTVAALGMANLCARCSQCSSGTTLDLSELASATMPLARWRRRCLATRGGAHHLSQAGALLTPPDIH